MRLGLMSYPVVAFLLAVAWALVSLRFQSPGFVFGFARGMAFGSLLAGILLAFVH